MKQLIPAVFLMAAGWVGATEWGGFAATKDLRASTQLSLESGAQVELRWKARAWDEQWVRELRQDPARRALVNNALPIDLDVVLRCDRALQAAGVSLAAGEHRLALRLDAAGAWELSALQRDAIFQSLRMRPNEDERRVSHLIWNLVPTERGAFVLRFAWGPEWGEVLFHET